MRVNKIFVCLLIAVFSLSLLSVASAQIVGSGSIDTGLAGYWRLDENTGTVANDSSGNSRTGTINGASWSTGKYGSALSFDGNNDNVNCGTTINPLSSMSVVAWFNASVVNDWKQKSIVCKYETSKYQWLIGITNEGKIRFEVYESQVSTKQALGGAISINTLYCVVGTFDGQNVRLYVNGVAVANETFSAPTTIQNVSPVLYVGYESLNARYFQGIIDDVRVYSRALSVSEISTLYQGYPITVSNDVGSTVTPNGTVTVGVDQSQSFLCGSLAGYSSWTQYIDGTASAATAVYTFSGVQASHTFYVTSQYIGDGDSAPITIEADNSIITIEACILFFLMIANVLFLKSESMMIRFLFALFTFVIGAIAITVSGLPFAPYFQMMVVVMSLICMLFAAAQRG